MKRAFTVLACLQFLTACLSSEPLPAGVAEGTASRADTASFKTLARAHAHNDYEHPRPLLDALEQGFTSVEADVYASPIPTEPGLYVAHDPQDIRLDRTLASLYLDPLRARVAQNGGCVYADCAQFHILVDSKTPHAWTYSKIEAELAKYPELFARVENGVVKPGPVMAILSGMRDKAELASSASRALFYDGTFADLDANDPISLMPLISDSWTAQLGWNGEGEMPEDQRAKLREAGAKAAAQGRRVRVYGTPDNENVWRECLNAGHTAINTDKLVELRAFLLANDR